MLTPEQFVLKCVHEYPTLYACKEFSSARISVFNQLFNVIGNGIRDENELMCELNKPFDTSVDYTKYTLGEPLYVGYTKMKTRGDLQFPDFTTRIEGAYTKKELDSISSLHGVVYWEELYKPKFEPRLSAMDSKVEYKWSPYPNFKEEYSIVWDDYFSKLGPAWINAAIEFYNVCLDYFNGDCSNYSYAYPCKTTVETENRDYDLTERLSTYTDFATISEEYGVAYNGNVQEFQMARWNAEKNRILDFIQNTLSRLDTMFNQFKREPSYSDL